MIRFRKIWLAGALKSTRQLGQLQNADAISMNAPPIREARNKSFGELIQRLLHILMYM